MRHIHNNSTVLLHKFDRYQINVLATACKHNTYHANIIMACFYNRMYKLMFEEKDHSIYFYEDKHE